MGKAARKLSGAALAEWRAKHPFDPNTGRFVKGGTGVTSPSAPTPGRARARLGLEPASAPVAPNAGRARAALSGRASKVDMPAALKALRAKHADPVSGDREAVDAILAPMTVKQLDEVAREFGFDGFVRGTKVQRVQQITESLVGRRLDHDAIMRVDLRSAFPPPTRGEAEQFFARQALQRGRVLAAQSDERHAELKREIMALEGAGTEGIRQAEAKLSGMTLPELKSFAATLGPTVRSKGTKTQLIHGIVEGTIGFRQRANAIGTANFGGQPVTPAPSGRARAAQRLNPGTSNLERLMGGRPQPGEFGGTGSVVDRLRSLTSVAEGRALIGGKSKAELLAIAEAVGISRPSGRTKSELIDSITYATITGPGSHAMLRRLGNQGKA